MLCSFVVKSHCTLIYAALQHKSEILSKVLALFVLAEGELLVCAVVNYHVVLIAVRADFVASHATAHLPLPVRGHCTICFCVMHLRYASCEFGHRLILGILPGTTLRCFLQSRWEMCDASTVLVFVSVLATSARARVPFHFEIGRVE